MPAAISIGLTGRTDAGVLRALAPRIERAGFAALWLNDVPGGDALAGLRIAAAVTTTLRLGTGVVPLDRRAADGLELHGLPADRLTIGVGSGASRSLGLVAAGLDALRARTDAELAVGALGPRMRRLAAERADGLVLNWLAPAEAAAATAQARRDADGRPVRSILYARTIVDERARGALEAEAAGYERAPAYAANFARLGMRAIDATVADAARLHAYDDAVDELVLRAVTPTATGAELEAFVEAAADWIRP